MSALEAQRTTQLQRALERRLRQWRRRMQLPEPADEAAIAQLGACVAEQIASSDWSVEDVRVSSTPLDNAAATHHVHLSDAGSSAAASSSGLLLGLSSLHPSREFASSHLQAALAECVRSHVAASRFWMEEERWSAVNWNLDEAMGRIEMRQLRICCAEEDDEEAGSSGAHARRLHFALPLLQSLRWVGQMTLSSQLQVDEQASQIALHTAQTEQADAGGPPSQELLQRDYQRFSEAVTFLDEHSGALAATAVTPALLPCMARLFHALSLPLSLASSTLPAALSGFSFLQHLLVDTSSPFPAVSTSCFESASTDAARQCMEQLLLECIWPPESSAATSSHAPVGCSLLLSEHARLLEEQALDDGPLSSLEDVEEVEPGTVSSAFARLALAVHQQTEEAAPPIQAPAAFVSAAAAAVTAADPPSLDECRTLPTLVVSYLALDDFLLEFHERDVAQAVSTHAPRSTAATKAGSKARHAAKGKSSKRR